MVERSTFPIGSSMSARNRMPCASCASLPSFIFSRFSSASSVPAASAAAMSAAFSARIAASFASRASATRRCHTNTHARRPRASPHRSLRTLLHALAPGTRRSRTNAALRASVVSDCNPRDAARAAKAISVDTASGSIVVYPSSAAASISDVGRHRAHSAAAAGAAAGRAARPNGPGQRQGRRRRTACATRCEGASTPPSHRHHREHGVEGARGE